MAARGHAPNEDIGVDAVPHHPNAVAEDGSPAERRGRVDGDDPHLLPRRAKPSDELVDQRAFARARRASYPQHNGVFSASENLPHQPLSGGGVVLNERDGLGDGPGIPTPDLFDQVPQYSERT